MTGRKLKPLGPGKDPRKGALYKEMLDSITMGFHSHIIHHSDSDGFYVPVDFPKDRTGFARPIYDGLPDEDKGCIPGGILVLQRL